MHTRTHTHRHKHTYVTQAELNTGWVQYEQQSVFITERWAIWKRFVPFNTSIMCTCNCKHVCVLVFFYQYHQWVIPQKAMVQSLHYCTWNTGSPCSRVIDACIIKLNKTDLSQLTNKIHSKFPSIKVNPHCMASATICIDYWWLVYLSSVTND